jgi:hypothetical protein
MKKIVSALAALAITVPSAASAATASQALSVKSAAVKPVRTSAKQGDNRALPTPVLVILIAGVVGGVAAIVSGGNDSR